MEQEYTPQDGKPGDVAAMRTGNRTFETVFCTVHGWVDKRGDLVRPGELSLLARGDGMLAPRGEFEDE
jgi:hypothetical protein